ncbi:hypothetical protein HK097_001729, partial [Rhizophlyctis rosea]
MRMINADLDAQIRQKFPMSYAKRQQEVFHNPAKNQHHFSKILYLGNIFKRSDDVVTVFVQMANPALNATYIQYVEIASPSWAGVNTQRVSSPPYQFFREFTGNSIEVVIQFHREWEIVSITDEDAYQESSNTIRVSWWVDLTENGAMEEIELQLKKVDVDMRGVRQHQGQVQPLSDEMVTLIQRQNHEREKQLANARGERMMLLDADEDYDMDHDSDLDEDDDEEDDDEEDDDEEDDDEEDDDEDDDGNMHEGDASTESTNEEGEEGGIVPMREWGQESFERGMQEGTEAGIGRSTYLGTQDFMQSPDEEDVVKNAGNRTAIPLEIVQEGVRNAEKIRQLEVALVNLRHELETAKAQAADAKAIENQHRDFAQSVERRLTEVQEDSDVLQKMWQEDINQRQAALAALEAENEELVDRVRTMGTQVKEAAEDSENHLVRIIEHGKISERFLRLRNEYAELKTKIANPDGAGVASEERLRNLILEKQMVEENRTLLLELDASKVRFKELEDERKEDRERLRKLEGFVGELRADFEG